MLYLKPNLANDVIIDSRWYSSFWLIPTLFPTLPDFLVLASSFFFYYFSLYGFLSSLGINTRHWIYFSHRSSWLISLPPSPFHLLIFLLIIPLFFRLISHRNIPGEEFYPDAWIFIKYSSWPPLDPWPVYWCHFQALCVEEY